MSSHISDNKQHPRSRAPQGWHHMKMGNPFHENKPKIVMCTVRVIPPRLLSLLSKHEDDSFSLHKEDWLCLKYWLTLFTWCHSCRSLYNMMIVHHSGLNWKCHFSALIWIWHFIIYSPSSCSKSAWVSFC